MKLFYLSISSSSIKYVFFKKKTENLIHFNINNIINTLLYVIKELVATIKFCPSS